jgi:hypothetical protein
MWILIFLLIIFIFISSFSLVEVFILFQSTHRSSPPLSYFSKHAAYPAQQDATLANNKLFRFFITKESQNIFMAYNRCTNWTIDCHLFVCRAMSSSQTIRLLCSTMVDNQSVHPTSIPLHLPFPIYQPTQILHPATPFISPYPLSTWPTLPPQCCRSGSLSLSLNQSSCISVFVNCRGKHCLKIWFWDIDYLQIAFGEEARGGIGI